MWKTLGWIFRKVLVVFKLFYWRSFAQPRKSPRGYITCAGKTDGAGAQALSIISVQLFAQDCGFTYVHSPFKKIEHNYWNDPDWEAQWEDFLGLGVGETSCEQINISQLHSMKLAGISEIPTRSNSCVLYTVPHAHEYANLFPNAYLKILNKLSAKYTSKSKLSYSTYSTDKYYIAVHVRRGDINSNGEFSIRYTTNTSIIHMIECLIDNLKISGISASMLSLSIFSQGDRCDFSSILEEFEEVSIDLHLDESPFATIHGLVEADILVMSKSTFSYLAALLSPGLKIYDRFYHPPIKDWLVWDERKGFSNKEFQRKLNSIMKKKLP
jgi:hypothetical protein